MFVIASLFLWQFALLSLAAARCPSYEDIQKALGNALSYDATIDQDNRNAPRWNESGAPHAAYVVNVASEADVAVTVSIRIFPPR